MFFKKESQSAFGLREFNVELTALIARAIEQSNEAAIVVTLVVSDEHRKRCRHPDTHRLKVRQCPLLTLSGHERLRVAAVQTGLRTPLSVIASPLSGQCKRSLVSLVSSNEFFSTWRDPPRVLQKFLSELHTCPIF
jgi:hypothetical protein